MMIIFGSVLLIWLACIFRVICNATVSVVMLMGITIILSVMNYVHILGVVGTFAGIIVLSLIIFVLDQMEILK